MEDPTELGYIEIKGQKEEREMVLLRDRGR